MPEEKKPFFLIGMSDRGDVFELSYGEAPNDPLPFLLTITREYVAHKTSQAPPTISRLDVTDYINRNLDELKTIAESSKARGRDSEVLK